MVDSDSVKVNTIAEALSKLLDPSAMTIWDDQDNCVLTKLNTNK